MQAQLFGIRGQLRVQGAKLHHEILGQLPAYLLDRHAMGSQSDREPLPPHESAVHRLVRGLVSVWGVGPVGPVVVLVVPGVF